MTSPWLKRCSFLPPIEYVIADKGYDAGAFVQVIRERGAVPVIPPRSNRKVPREYDAHLYKERHLVECFINKIKHYRRIFSRYDKLAMTYLSHLAATKCQQKLIHNGTLPTSLILRHRRKYQLHLIQEAA